MKEKKNRGGATPSGGKVSRRKWREEDDYHLENWKSPFEKKYWLYGL